MPAILPLKERLKGMIWGQFVGDAAALGSHWIYDLKELEARYPHGVQGFEAPRPGDYHAGKTAGQPTHYGVAALELLRSIAACHAFSATDFGARFVEAFASPEYRGYIDRTARETIQNYHDFLENIHPDLPYDFQAGADNDEISTATRLAPLLAAYWDDPKLEEIVETATRVTQNNAYAIAYMRFHARIVQGLLAGDSLHAVFEKETHPLPHDTPIVAHIRQKIVQAIDLVPLSTTAATLQLGQACPLPQSFPAAIQCALKHQHAFADGITATLRAGGNNAGRAALVGTWLGAHLGYSHLPQEWLARLHDRDEIAHLSDCILSLKNDVLHD